MVRKTLAERPDFSLLRCRFKYLEIRSGKIRLHKVVLVRLGKVLLSKVK
jgi:hypothetical protein